MKHIFVVNPAAGGGQAEKTVLPLVRAALKDKELDYEIHRTLNKSETAEYVRQKALEGVRTRFYACGGDGTLNDVLTGMLGFENADLALVPCGTGNDFAKNFSSRDRLRDIEALMKADTVPCDVIKYGGGCCLNMFNIGIDCDVVVESRKTRGILAGSPMSYAAAALKVLSKGKTYRMAWELDGERREDEIMLCAVANGRFCGGGFKSSPLASVRDGIMDVAVVRPVRGLKMLRLLLKYRQGTYLEAEEAKDIVEYFKCESFRLIPLEDVHVAVDGEVEEFKETEFRVAPSAVRIAVPEGCELL
ncbi:MAG: diacylglycerol kinase family lipid kinase [Firmicutes bacterium]|nr:diacylglycerol kinase family lipid kinase [Bacillota bacterium]